MARCPCYVRFVQQSGRYEIADVSDGPDDLKIDASQTNLTPIRRSFRQSTRQAKCDPSLGIAKVNVAGMPTGVATSSAAPLVERLRTVQSIAPPPNSIVPLFNTRCRGVARFSIIDLPARTLADNITNGGCLL
jgi:hypothetical protein